MKLDIGTLMFNMNCKVGGTPSWGTEMGQNNEYKFDFEDQGNLITSLTYKCVDDIENVNCNFGKGGSRNEDFNIILAGLYDKVFVNNELIQGAQFLLIIAKQIYNPNGFHIGRRTLKYSPNMTYKNVKINEECFRLIRERLGLNENSAWFINEINTKNQDELHLMVYIADKENPMNFENSSERKKYVEQLIGINTKTNTTIDTNKYANTDKTKERLQGGYSKIYYGAPGTGKSYKIDDLLKKEGIKDENRFRTTFHPEYTYNDFVGQLLPAVVKNADNTEEITYKFQKGPFTLALEKAYNTPDEAIYLVIEEMSRGNCAQIFGDIFQLIDRIKKGTDKDWSRYIINNDVIAKDIEMVSDGKIRIPSNLFILGTINTSDQNVFVMDTAFKRRFDWEYISTKPVTDEKGEYANNTQIVLDNEHEISWIELYQILNKFIASSEKLGLGEDKQIGQFFIEFDQGDNKDKIKNKLLHYLWFDIHEASYKSDIKLFDNEITSFSDLYDKYEKGQKVFSDEFLRDVYNSNNL